MAKYILFTMYFPAEGHEREFDDWHWGKHTPLVLSGPGFVSAQRYHLAELQLDRPQGIGPATPDAPPPANVPPWPFMVIYEIETDDLQSVVDGFYDSASRSQFPVPAGAADTTRPVIYYIMKAVTPRVESLPDTHPQLEPEKKDPVDAVQRARAYSAPNMIDWPSVG